MTTTGMTKPLSHRLERLRRVRDKSLRDKWVTDTYQEYLDTLNSLEYTLDSSDVDREIERRFTLLDAVDKEQIKDSVSREGLTNSEREFVEQERHAQDMESVKSFIRSATAGTVVVEAELGSEEREVFQQRQLLRSNALYADYMAYKIGHRSPVDFMTYCEAVGGRAFIRLMTRMKGRKELIREFIGGSGNLPRLEDVQEFVILDKHREKDPGKFVASLYLSVPGSKAVVHRLLNRYSDMVREEWTKMRVRPESPLPGEEDWLFEKALDGDAMELAVTAYESGTPLNAAASLFKVSNRRLRDILSEKGVLRARGGK